MVNKLTLPAKDNAVQEKINELVDEKQDLVPAGTAGDVVTYSGTAGTFGTLGYTPIQYALVITDYTA